MAGLFREIEEDEVPTPASPIKTRIEPSNYSGITIDTEYVPSSAVLLWAAGSTWNVDYYAQLTGSSFELRPLDLHLSPIEQQYKLLRRNPLKVTQALTWEFDPKSTLRVGRGGGYTFPFLKANVGDMFIANIGDGEAGVFTITSSRPATILKDSVYEVEWVCNYLVTPEVMENLTSKVEATYYFSMSSLQSGCGPFVTTAEKARIENYQTLRTELIRRYMSDFLSLDFYTFLIPDQRRRAYDHFVTHAWLKMVSPEEDPRVRKVRAQNVTGEQVMKQPTFWDAILRGDPARLYGSIERMELVSTSNFRYSPLLQAIGFTGIPLLAYPVEVPTDVDSQYAMRDTSRPVGTPFNEGRPRRPLPGEAKKQAELNLPYFKAVPSDVVDIEPWKRPADIHPVTIDDYYVLSEAFYTQGPGQSKLELLTRQYLNHETLNADQLNAVLASAHDWTNLERFYYHPLLIALLKTLLR